MIDFDLPFEAERSLKKLQPKILSKIQTTGRPQAEQDLLQETIEARLREHWMKLFGLLHRLYGHHYDFFYYLENILLTAIDCWLERPPELLDLDRRRENNPNWYLSERMVGGSLYVDLFSDDLPTLRTRIPYLKELGLTYLHLMPVFSTPEGNNDGGYAINDYRTIDPDLGTMDDLRALSHDLREAGISLVLDFVFNHTADDHAWAIRAQEGDREYMNYYRIFPDRTMPDRYEIYLREIFPSVRRGNFTWHNGVQGWVWTTFNSFQWDLNYDNPEVFRAMASEMLFLANTGVEMLRLDAVAFIWKQLGTSCENLPEAHLLIRAFNAVCRIAAPSLVFKSEAIVHPDEVSRYISREECQVSYNPTLMALLWESIATRKVTLLRRSLERHFNLSEGTSWVNYLRGHDDIGWSFDDADCWAMGTNPQHHRHFLNQFFTGAFPGSFAAGLPFQYNPDTGDMRVSGTMASLAGLEEALKSEDPQLIDTALLRIRMLYGVLCSIGGIPIIFLGEEIGALNDYSFKGDAAKMDDSRWVHRPRMNWDQIDNMMDPNSVRGRAYHQLRNIFEMRKSTHAIAGNIMTLLPTNNEHVLGYLRKNDGLHLVVLANFSEHPQDIDLREFRVLGLAHHLKDRFTDEVLSTGKVHTLPPYALYWLDED
jgi:amylosucrase